MAKALRHILIEKAPDIEQSTAMPPEKAKEKEFIDMHKIQVHGDLPWDKLGVGEKASLGPDAGKKEEMKKIREFLEDEADLDDLTEEQIEGLITEISKKVLGSYIKKATSDVAVQGVKYGTASTQKSGSRDAHKAMLKGHKRQKGIEKATDRLTKEEVEQLDELDRKTLKSYERKATTSRDREERKGAAEEDKAMETDGTKNPEKQNRHNANASAHFKKMIRRDRGLAMVKKRLEK